MSDGFLTWLGYRVMEIDLLFAGLSLLFVYLFITLHTQSFFLLHAHTHTPHTHSLIQLFCIPPTTASLLLEPSVATLHYSPSRCVNVSMRPCEYRSHFQCFLVVCKENVPP